MNTVLVGFAFLIGLIVIFTLINERILELPNDISLLLLSFLIGGAIMLLKSMGVIDTSSLLFEKVSTFRLDEYLLDGVLCFMLFSGASNLKFRDLLHNIKPICFLALLTTLISSFAYGGLFYLINMGLGLHMNFLTCALIGCIVSPTDPIAATSILNKLGLSEDIIAVIEGESLFNDGTGVALFVCISSMITGSSKYGFFELMARELLGAISIGLLISFALFQLVKKTTNAKLHIFISLFAVSSCYIICEELGFSGVIVSVVCGIYFTTMMEKLKLQHPELDPEDCYHDFWEVIDTLLNSILYVLIGLSFLNITNVPHIFALSVVAIVMNFLARGIGVGISATIIKKLPGGYTLSTFTELMTWTGLKGGLSLALALSTSEMFEGYTGNTIYGTIMAVTYVTIFFTTVVQGLGTAKIYGFIQKQLAKQTGAAVEAEASVNGPQIGASVVNDDSEQNSSAD